MQWARLRAISWKKAPLTHAYSIRRNRWVLLPKIMAGDTASLLLAPHYPSCTHGLQHNPSLVTHSATRVLSEGRSMWRVHKARDFGLHEDWFQELLQSPKSIIIDMDGSLPKLSLSILFYPVFKESLAPTPAPQPWGIHSAQYNIRVCLSQKSHAVCQWLV